MEDFTEYFRLCRQRITDPAAVRYLDSRGISLKTAEDAFLGFDPAADPASAPGAMGDEYRPHPAPRIIIPVSEQYYIARRTDGENSYKALNPKDRTPEVFDTRIFKEQKAQEVFIVEGAFDALAIMESDAEAIAINSTANVSLLLDYIKKYPAETTYILFLDNDEAGRKATETLKEELPKLNAKYIVADFYNGTKDANEALIKDRYSFLTAVKEAVAAAEKQKAAEEPQPLNGLLTLERAIATLEDEDTDYITLPNFPQLSAMLKLRKRDNVVIAADTGAGKSSLAINFLHELQDRYPILYFNLEMTEATVLQRLVAIHTGLTLDQIEGYKKDANTREKVNAAFQEILAGREIQIINDCYDLDEIEKQIQTATAGRTEPTIVFIDTALLVTTGETDRYKRFTKISETLRRITRLNNIVLFELLQQNRAGKAEDKEPTNASLKESGSWENDSEKIMFLWDNPQERCKEIKITKNRKGEIGKVKLSYMPHTQRYQEPKDGFLYSEDTPFTEDGWTTTAY